MWSAQTVWFDIAVVMSVFAVGNILFGHFEEHKPKALRLLKVGLVVGLTAALSYLLSRVSRRRASSLPFQGAEDDPLCREQLSIDLAFGRSQPD
jgi:hypothetical protein